MKKMLFPTDLSELSNAALPVALEYADRLQAELHVLHAVVLHDAEPLSTDKGFEESERILAEAKVPIERHHRRGLSAAEAILDYARDEGVDLIAMATHGRSTPARLLLGSVAEEVVRHATCPVMAIKKEAARTGIPSAPKVLVPHDFSEGSERAVDTALALFDKVAELRLVHVLETPAVLPTEGFAPPTVLIPTTAREARRKLEGLQAEIVERHPGIKVEIDVTEGLPGSEIIRCAGRCEADIIVMGTLGLTGLEHLVFGSVAEKVVRKAPCAVFTVRAPQAQAASGERTEATTR